jgi:hypothetical protein
LAGWRPRSQSDWEESSEEDAPKKPATGTTTAAPPKKKGTLKAKLAEKEAAKAKAKDEDDDDYDEDAVLDPREKARRDRERELKSDLDNAASLFGQSAPSASICLLLAPAGGLTFDRAMVCQPRPRRGWSRCWP